MTVVIKKQKNTCQFKNQQVLKKTTYLNSFLIGLTPAFSKREGVKRHFNKSFILTKNKTDFYPKSMGNLVILLPVAAYMALHKAAINGGTGGSPTPVGFSALSIRCTSVA